MKTLFKIVLVLILLVVIAGGALFFFKDTIVAGIIKTELAKATGTEVNLADTNLDVFGGALTLDGLEIANPADFTGGDVLAIQQFRTELDLGSVSTDTPHVKLLSLDGVAIRLEVKGSKVNLYELKKNIDKYAGPEDEPTTSGEKTFKVDKVTLTNISVATVGSLPGAFEVKAGATVPDIELTNLEGTAGQITRQIVTQLIGDVVEATGLPNLEQATELLEGLGGEVGKQLQDQLNKQGGDLLGNLKDQMDIGGNVLPDLGGPTTPPVKPEDAKPEDDKPQDVKHEDVKPEDVEPEDDKPADAEGEGNKLNIPLDVDLGGLDGVLTPKSNKPKPADAADDGE